MVWLGYGIGVFVFGVSSVDMGVYVVVYNIIRFYIWVYCIYEMLFKIF